ncbi:hypothetical protein HMI56_002829, partial [Coelomomyces lativittatus]
MNCGQLFYHKRPFSSIRYPFSSPDPKLYLLFSSDHQAKDCSQGVKCYNCGGQGHTSRECTSARVEKACHRCNEVGHLAKD